MADKRARKGVGASGDRVGKPRRGAKLSAGEQAKRELLSGLSRPVTEFTPADVTGFLAAYMKRKRELEPAPPRITDPELGTLTCELAWWHAAPRPVAGFGDNVRVSFDVPNALERKKSKTKIPPPPRPPTGRQRTAYRNFFAETDRYRRVVEEANWRFYLENIHDRDDEGYPPAVTRLREPSQVWKLLSHPRVSFPARDEPGWWVVFTWECRWDPEHGHKVVLRSGKAHYVGQQGGW